jgi:hypothetical protein
MKSKTPIVSFVPIFVVILLSYSIGFARDYEITKVVKIGPEDSSAINGPLKWSPDDKNLAFIFEGHVAISDTLGNIKKIAATELGPFRFEWLSNKEIVVFERENTKSANSQNGQAQRQQIIKMIRYDISNGEKTILDEFIWNIGEKKSKLIDGYLEGPYLSIQKNLYYYKYINDVKIPIFPESRYDKKADPADNYIYRINAGGLCLIGADLQDSIWAHEKNYLDTLTNYDQKYRFADGIITDLSNNSQFIVNDIPELSAIQDTTRGCSCLWEHISPLKPEIVFQYSCDIDDFTSFGKACLYNFITGNLTVLDDIAGDTDCSVPSFSNKGDKIVINCQGNAYILFRRANVN